MIGILERLTTCTITVVKCIIKIFVSLITSMFILAKTHALSGNGEDFIAIMATTVLIYWLLSRNKVDAMCKKFFLWLWEMIPANAKKKEGKNKILLLEDKLNEEKTLNLKELDSMINSIKKEYCFDDKKIHKYLLETLNNTIDNALDDSEISKELEKNIQQFCSYAQITTENAPKLFKNLSKGILLREISNGNFPQVRIQGHLPFNLLKDEKIVWYEENIKYHIIKDQVHYEGGSAGYSVRVAKGFSVRQNSYKGAPVHTKSLECEDEGIFLITTKNVYFGGVCNKFRIPYAKILSYEPYKDAIMIQKDAASAKPMFFEISDPEFACDLIMRLAQSSKDDIDSD